VYRFLLCVAVAGCTGAPPPPSGVPQVIVDEVHDFGRVPSTKSATWDVEIRNVGAVAADLLGFENETADAAFTAAFTPVTLAPGGRLLVPVTFMAASGTHAATFVVRFNGGEVRTRLTATVDVVDCSVEATLDFGNLVVGDVARVAPPRGADAATLTPGAGFSVEQGELVFSPTEVRAYSASIVVKREHCPDATVALTGTGLSTVFDCAPLELGYVPLGRSLTKQATLRNLTSKAHTFTFRRTISADWSVPAAPVTVPALGSVSVPITLMPSRLGPLIANVVFDTTLPAQGQVGCIARGGGGGPELDVEPAALDFGEVPYFASQPYASQRRLTVHNRGAPANDPSANLRLTAVRVMPKNTASTVAALCVGALDVATGTCTPSLAAGWPAGGVPPGGRFEVPVHVTPPSAGQELEWDVEFDSNDFDEPALTVNVKARSVASTPCQYTVTPAQVDVGFTPEQVRERVVTLRNTGTAAADTCYVDRIALAPGTDPEWSLHGPPGPLLLQPGASAELTVLATPRGRLITLSGGLEIAASTPSAPVRRVMLTGRVVAPCAAVSPPEGDWGAVKLGCRGATRTFAAFDRCGTLQGWRVQGSGFTGSGATSSSVDVSYAPPGLGSHHGTLHLDVGHAGVGVVSYEVPLHGSGQTVAETSETFTVPAATDVLLMFDDNAWPQNEFSANVSSFLAASTSDFHIGVAQIDSPTGAAWGELMGSSPLFFTQATPQLASLLAARVQLGSNFGPYEEAAASALAVLTPPLSTGRNAGFLRSEAALSIVAVTRAHDSSFPASYFAARLAALKPRGLLRYHVIGPQAVNVPQCQEHDGFPPTHAFMTSAFDGLYEAVCSPAGGWTAAVSRVGAAAFQRSLRYALAGDPDPATLGIEIAGSPIPAAGWTYDAQRNDVTVSPLYRPAAGASVTVRYASACR